MTRIAGGHISRVNHFRNDFQSKRQPDLRTRPNVSGSRDNFQHQPSHRNRSVKKADDSEFWRALVHQTQQATQKQLANVSDYYVQLLELKIANGRISLVALENFSLSVIDDQLPNLPHILEKLMQEKLLALSRSQS